MVGIVILIAWVVCGVLAFRPTFRGFLKDTTYGTPDGGDIVMALIMAAIACLFGPLTLAVVLVMQSARGDWRALSARIGGETKDEKIARLEARTAELERSAQL